MDPQQLSNHLKGVNFTYTEFPNGRSSIITLLILHEWLNCLGQTQLAWAFTHSLKWIRSKHSMTMSLKLDEAVLRLQARYASYASLFSGCGRSPSMGFQDSLQNAAKQSSPPIPITTFPPGGGKVVAGSSLSGICHSLGNSRAILNHLHSCGRADG